MDNTEKELLRKAVYDIVKTIPHGRATSYGAIAKATGYPNLSRMIGRIMSESDSDRTGIPAHRVVNGQGILSASEAFNTPNRMQKLLEDEGIIIKNNRIQNWKTIFWNPMDEIQL